VTMTHFYNLGQEVKEKAKNNTPIESLLIWWDRLTAKDPSLEDANWRYARGNGDVSGNEFRARKLGLPPNDEKEESVIPAALGTVIQGTLVSLGMGSIQPSQARAFFEGLGVPTKLAETICGVGLEQVQQQEPVEAATEELKRAILMLKSDPYGQAERIVRQLTLAP